MCCSKKIGTFRTAHNIIMSNKQPWRFLLYSWGILREPPHFCVDESVYNHPNNWPHFVPQKVTLTRSEWSFFYSGKNKEMLSKKKHWLWGNVSWVVEFQRWWVLKSKLFAQESTCSKEILISTGLNHLWFLVNGVIKAGYLDFSWKKLKYCVNQMLG